MTESVTTHPADGVGAPTLDYRGPTAPPASRKAVVDLTHSGMNITRYLAMHVMGALFPITAGLMLYGWRAAGAIFVLLSAALLSAAVWRRIGLRGPRVRYDQVVWLALLLALTLPAHLLTSSMRIVGETEAPWPILVCAGAALAMFVWMIGGVGSGRLHPVIITHLLIFVLFADMLVPHFALRREHALWGDVLNVPSPADQPMPSTTTAPTVISRESLLESSKQAWITAPPEIGIGEAVSSIPAAQRLESFTGGHEAPERAWVSLESLVRDRLPPLEDLIVGGQPAPIGQGSAIALIIGGLFLLYRGLIDYRVPLLIFLGALIGFLVLPVPVVITESSKVWRWLALRDSSVGPALGVTFANYEMMASPLVFTAFFLATSSAVRPLSRRARTIYALLIGVTSAAFQLYASVMIGPYLALLGVSLMTPWLDRVFRPRALV
jgi:Na+-translocating ferredoxin:NAD+ oxidoreductase RnfD subunit